LKKYFREILEKPHLFDILYFLETFQYQEEGIKQKHFRYFLMTIHNLQFTKKLDSFYLRNKQIFELFAPLHKKFPTTKDILLQLKRMEKIKDKVEQEKQKQKFILGLWRRNNIKNEKDLDQYLRRLCKNKLIKKTNNKRPYHYSLSDEFQKNFKELKINEYITRWDFDDQTMVTPKRKKDYSYDSSIFGVSEKIFNEKDQEKIGQSLKIICENLIEILELKNQKTLKLLDGMNDTEKEKLSSIDFFFHGSRTT
jgi:hypothetical protein